MVGGFMGGIAFAIAHTYFNIRYDLPLYLIFRGMGAVVPCAGSACRPYFYLSIILSSIVWALIIATIANFLPRDQEDSKEIRPSTDHP